MTLKLVAFGAFAGLTWAASLRGYMAQLAELSRVSWDGTFLLILLPGAVIGGLLGWAEAIRRSGGRRGWRWIAIAPLAFPVLALTPPGALINFLTTGIGGGSIALVLTAIAGGFAISGRGPLAARILVGVLAAAEIVAGAVSQVFINRRLALDTPHGAWVALLGATLVIALGLACSIPHRRVVVRERE
jgi:hypothetical protein